jgi:aminopeptidase YwaD
MNKRPAITPFLLLLRRIFTLLLPALFVVPVFSQDTSYARKVIGQLTSPEFKGRGYLENGDKIAAEYLKSELVRLGIKPLDGEYFQPFRITINTIPGEISLAIDNNMLEPGADYIVFNSSGSCKGTYNLIWLDQYLPVDLLKKDLSETFLVVDTARIKDTLILKHLDAVEYGNTFRARGIIEVNHKRSLQVERGFANSFVNLQISKDKIPYGSKQITLSFKNKLQKNYKTQNVYGYIPGETDTFIVFGAHYDHLGKMGNKVYFPGANDNASGCAMLLNLADWYVRAENKPHYSIAFVFFSAEEVGLVGSKAYTENPPFPLNKIRFMMNLDMVGTGEEGIKVVNGSILKSEFDLLTRINNENKYLAKVSARGEAANSDHYFFYKRSVKSVFIYTLGGISEYHNIYDKAETLPLTEFSDLFRLITDFISAL